MPAKIRGHTMAMWLQDPFDSEKDYSEEYEVLKQGAADRGYDPESMHNTRAISHTSYPGTIVEADFYEKDDERKA